jgi:SIR2-like domain
MTDELGERCRPYLESAGYADRLPTRFRGGLFEQWMSRLASDQPDYSAATNAENRGLFARTSETIARVLDSAQRGALLGPCPTWLPDLVAWFHQFQSTVITFNYDNLIEYVVMTKDLQGSDGTQRRRVLPVDILGDLPPYPAQPARLAGPLATTFQLLKLHGSLDWRWSSGDESGATLSRFDLTGEWEHPGLPDAAEISRRLPGREPFIVPPTAIKSAYYTNPITRELWNRASTALDATRVVILIGYSMPITDLVFTAMLRENVHAEVTGIGRQHFVVVDLSPEKVRENLFSLGYDQVHIAAEFGGESCVADFVSGFTTDSEQYRRLIEYSS